MPGTIDWGDRLNDAQRRAVEHDSGPLVVLAGPGTGKTRVIIARILRLLDQGAEPESILAVTFTVKATAEMRQRLGEALADTALASTAERINISTLHAMGANILRRFGDMIGARSELTLMDAAQQRRLIRSLIRELDLFRIDVTRGRDAAVDRAAQFIGRCKNAARTPLDAAAYAQAWRGRIESGSTGLEGDELAAERYDAAAFAEHAALYAAYEKACLEKGLVMFDDYLSLPLRLFEERDTAAALFRADLRHIVVDEFQDLNAAQIELLRHIAPPRPDRLTGGPDLCVVGDDDQAIYGFRGADPRAFERFGSIWERHETIRLEENYRSAAGVIAAANAVIERTGERYSREKRIVAARGGQPPGVLEGVIVPDDWQAGTVLAAMILEDRAANPERPWSDYAVIARTKSFRDTVGFELETQGIPIDLRIPDSPLEDQGVRDVFSWLRLLADRNADEDAHRLLVRPMFGVEPVEVSRWREQHRAARGRGTARSDFASFADWLVTSRPDDGVVQLMGRTLAELRKASATEPADRLIERIIRTIRVGAGDGFGTDTLDGVGRAGRVQRLVQMIRFARSRQPFLDPPGGAAEFLKYYEDLDEAGQKFEAPNLERLDSGPDAPEPDGEAGGVRVLTAHAAKGLEFDTVFVVRVRPQYGFPSSERADSLPVTPDEFLGRAGAPRSDEERRLFYVACTRAKRRLVLVAKAKKDTKSATTDFFNELLIGAPELGFVRHESGDILQRSPLPVPADKRGPPELDGPGSAGGREAMIDREMARLRQAAFLELRAAEDPGTSAEVRSQRHRRLADLFDAMGALGGVRSGAGLPEYALPGSPGHGIIAHTLERLARRDHAGSFAAPKPPLRLSFTSLKKYESCPRCWYLQNMLGLDEAKTDQLQIGDIAHRALHAFYRERSEAEADGRAVPGLERLLALAGKLYRELWPPSREFDEGPLEQIESQFRLMMSDLHDDREERIEALEQSVTFDYLSGGARPTRSKPRSTAWTGCPTARFG